VINGESANFEYSTWAVKSLRMCGGDRKYQMGALPSPGTVVQSVHSGRRGTRSRTRSRTRSGTGSGTRTHGVISTTHLASHMGRNVGTRLRRPLLLVGQAQATHVELISHAEKSSRKDELTRCISARGRDGWLGIVMDDDRYGKKRYFSSYDTKPGAASAGGKAK